MKIVIFALFSLSLSAYQSATGQDAAYRSICSLAASDPSHFQSFRSQEAYFHAVEIGPDGAFAIYLNEYGYESTMERLEAFRQLDQIGDPVMFDFPKIGLFSGTTLRYIVIADQISGLFSLPVSPKIAEIGAGFGGQCYILSQMIPFSRYWIYDLPETERLINKVIEILQVPNVSCLPIEASFPEAKIDLLVSNYAFSECEKAMQMEYFEKVIKKADRGYVLYNRTEGIGAMSPEEFFALLKASGMKPVLYPEPVLTYEGNVLITWDRT